MAPDLLQMARTRYQDQVPSDCFLVSVPFWLLHTPDHVVAPAHDLRTEDGSKWMKVSNYIAFLKSSGDFCQGAEKETKLFVIIMPYMPLSDAHDFHQLISEPDLLPFSFAKSLLKDGEDEQEPREAAGSSADLGLGNPFQEGEESEDEQETEWETKAGYVTLKDGAVTVSFIVTNYSVLWAKAERHCLMMFMSDPIVDILNRLESYQNHLHIPPDGMQLKLEGNIEEAKRQLVFAIYHSRMEAHDTILSLYPEMHTAIYQPGCVHCDPDIHLVDEEDSPETLSRLSAALADIGFQENGAHLSVEKAQKKLMCAQGHLEFYTIQSQAMHDFSAAKENFRIALLPVLHGLRLASSRATVIGVSAMDLHGEA